MTIASKKYKAEDQRGVGKQNKAHCRILKQNPVFSAASLTQQQRVLRMKVKVRRSRKEAAAAEECTTPFVSPPLHRQLDTRALSRARKIANWAPEVGQWEQEKCVKVNEIVQFGIYKCCAPFF